MKLYRALCGVKQAGRQWSLFPCKTLVGTFGMEQCRAGLCVFWKLENKDVILILVVHVDYRLVSGNETVCEDLLGVHYH